MARRRGTARKGRTINTTMGSSANVTHSMNARGKKGRGKGGRGRRGRY